MPRKSPGSESRLADDGPREPARAHPALRILVIGYGNPGRRDDGLGPALAARVEAQQWPGVTVQGDYQLVIEDSALVAGHDLVVFADAAEDLSPGAAYELRPVTAAPSRSSFSHHLSPPAVLQLAADCFGARPQAWMLGIRAVDLDSYAEGLTPEAEKNLDAAIDALRDAVSCWRRGCQWDQAQPNHARARG